MGKRRRESGSSNASDADAASNDGSFNAGEEHEHRADNDHDHDTAMLVDSTTTPATEEGKPALQLKIKLSMGNPSPTEPAVPSTSTAPPAAAAASLEPPVDFGAGTAELVKMRRRNKSDTGLSTGTKEEGGTSAEGTPSKGSEKRPSKRHKPDPELAAAGAGTPDAQEKGVGEEKEKEKGKGKAGGKGKAAGGVDAKTAFLQLLEDLRGHLASDGRQMIALFEKLPTKKELPDYYQLIEHPMDVKTIEAKVKKDEYKELADLKADVELMFNNAKDYNMPGSEIYKDAVALQKFFNSRASHVKIAPPAPPPAAPALKITLKRSESGVEAKEAAESAEKEKEEKEKEKEEKEKIVRKKLTDKEIGLYFQAIFEDKEEEVKKFLAPPYNVNIARLFNAKLDGNDFRWTALQAAAFYGASNSIRALMAAGAAVEQQDEWFGGRALAWACYGNHPEVAKMLMDEFKADPKAENNGGQVAWDLVADKTEEKWKGIILSDAEWTKQRDEIIAKLPKDASGKLMVLPSGPPPPSKSKTLLAEEYVKLHNILKADDPDALHQFGLERRFDVNHQYNTRELGETFKWGPLHAAAYFGAIKCVRSLIAKGARVDAADGGFGSQPLAWAVYGNHYEVAKALVEEFKADREHRNLLEKKPLDMVEESPPDPKWVSLLTPKLKLKISDVKRPMDGDEEDEELDSGMVGLPQSGGSSVTPDSFNRYPQPPSAGSQMAKKQLLPRPPGPAMPTQRFPAGPMPPGYSPYGPPGTPGMPPGPGMPPSGVRPGYYGPPPPGYPAGAPPGYGTPGFPPRPMPGVTFPAGPVPPRPPAGAGPAPPKLTLYVQRSADKPLIQAVEVRSSKGSFAVKLPTTDTSVALSSIVLPPANSPSSYSFSVYLAPSDIEERKVQFQMNGLPLLNVTHVPAPRKEPFWKVDVNYDILRDGPNMLECIATEKQESADKTVTSWKADSYMLVAMASKSA